MFHRITIDHFQAVAILFIGSQILPMHEVSFLFKYHSGQMLSCIDIVFMQLK